MTKETIDLGKAFGLLRKDMSMEEAQKELLNGLRKAYDHILVQNGENYAYGFGMLASSVKIFLVRTTDMDVFEIDRYIVSEPEEKQGEL